MLAVMLAEFGPPSVLTPAELPGVARHAEQAGLDGIFTGDHLAAAVPRLDAAIVLAIAASATSRVKIGFGVMVLALRGPAWAAKQVATLQALSEGRVILGVGTGGGMHGTAAWDAVGIPSSGRGPSTDAALKVLPDLITGAPATLTSGARLQLAPGAAMPPLWIGGMSAAAQRRAARFGDAWFPSMLLASELASARRRLRDLAAGHGRPVPAITLGAAALLGPPQPTARDAFIRGLTDGYGIPAETAEHVPITGNVSQAASRLAEYADARASHLVVGLVGENWPAQCELLTQACATLPA